MGQVLAAVPPPAVGFLESALGGWVRLTACHSYADAGRRIGKDGGIDLVLCGVYFDRSRMFDLMQLVDRRLPVVCCRILDFEKPAISMQALRIACESLGAAFLDLPALRQEHGAGAADSALLSCILARLKKRSF
jgi:hypothetical protein